jgi:hypothetical protein
VTDDLENRLHRAMHAYPWTDSSHDLAARAMARAQAREAAADALRARLDLQRRRFRLFNLAAFIVIATITAGMLWQVSWRDWLATPEPMASVQDTADADDVTWLPDEAALLLICGGLLLAALVWVAVDPSGSDMPRPLHPMSG